MTLYEDLKWRGLIKDTAGVDLQKKLDEEKITFYWGTDPTADSLHVGHYSSLVTAKRLYKAGHKPILLVGGATGLIGDPRPTAEREIISYEEVERNIKGIAKQVDKIFDGNALIVNNYDWLKDMNLITFLRDVGKYINVNYMLDKDIIRRRLETGITFAEFTYTLMQGYDFLYLYEHHNCIMQVEGSDQWGNITTGIDLIAKRLGKNAYAFTMPLILDASGKKFGKSEGNALWLDLNKTTSYELYQYLINTDDSKVLEYLKVFTFLTKEEIEEVMRKHELNKEERLAQKTLAFEFVKDLHGEEEALHAIKISELLFAGKIDELSSKEIAACFKGVPTFNCVEGSTLIDLLVDNKIAVSRREAREFLTSNAISINGKPVSSETLVIAKSLAIDNEVIVIRRGKKKYFLGRFQ